MNKIYIFLIFAFIAVSTNATSLDSAQTLYSEGKYREALPIFKELLAQKPNDALLNQHAGMCLFNLNNYIEALPLLQTAYTNGATDAAKFLTMIAIYQYDFDNAEIHLTNYKQSFQNDSTSREIELLSSQIMNARNMLERVEKIQIIDSINVDCNTFFKYYRLSKDIGTLNSSNILPQGFSATNPTIVFQPQSKSQLVWAMNDSTQKSHIVSSALLSDSTWEKPISLGDILNDGGNANYPFFMPDGYTLYFANDGVNSIGGYDIFKTRYDEDGFLQPQNLGMPYNSPYNDYMLVIDEYTGIGWWATDRNQIEGKITIYMFIPSDTRINYPSDTPNLINLAKINAINDTWAENANYDNYFNTLNNLTIISPETNSSQFSLNLPNGSTYHYISDFKNAEAAATMQEYLDTLNKYNKNKDILASLRLRYSQGDKSVTSQILSLENQVLREREELKRLLNITISLELK